MYFGSSVGCIPSFRLYSIRCLRNTLGLKVTEIPDFKTEPLIEASPVFSDDNITVFSIPVVPTPHHRGGVPAFEALSNLSKNVFKRKRESSPELSSKRPFLGQTVPVTDGPPTPSTSSPLLDRFSVDPEFDPTTLEGDEADAWRQLIIEHMFTRVEPPSRPQLSPKRSNKKGKCERNAGDTETETPEAYHPSQASLTSLPQVPHWVEGAAKCQEKLARRGPKGATPAGSLKPSPTFTPPVRDGSTAYIVVGPRVRGKFDVKRADELGLHRGLRARVARGEAVTFTVDDGTGAKVQRTVKPEDCIGEHETTRVSLRISAPCLLC
jgi:ribonuclease Z